MNFLKPAKHVNKRSCSCDLGQHGIKLFTAKIETADEISGLDLSFSNVRVNLW